MTRLRKPISRPQPPRATRTWPPSRNSALASLARQYQPHQGRNRSPYQELINRPTTTVSKVTAQLQLADLYHTSNQPLDAKRLYGGRS